MSCGPAISAIVSKRTGPLVMRRESAPPSFTKRATCASALSSRAIPAGVSAASPRPMRIIPAACAGASSPTPSMGSMLRRWSTSSTVTSKASSVPPSVSTRSVSVSPSSMPSTSISRVVTCRPLASTAMSTVPVRAVWSETMADRADWPTR